MDRAIYGWAALVCLFGGCLDSGLSEARGSRNDGLVSFSAWPADGTWGVPPHLPLLVVRFDDRETADAVEVTLEGPEGAQVEAIEEASACEDLHVGAGWCVVQRPTRPLTPLAAHRIVVSLGSAELASRFATGPEGVGADVSFLDAACAIDEREAGPACVLAEEDRAEVRIRASGPVRLHLAVGGTDTHAAAARGDATLFVDGLSPGIRYAATLRAFDLDGDEHSLGFEVHTATDLSPLFIAEVRANPRGPEPDQEYVEVVSSAGEPLDIRGYALADAPDDEGDVIEAQAIVPPAGRALLVPDGFDPQHPDDVPVPPGVVLVRLGTSLASGGITNRGEPLFLRDPAGRRLSAAPPFRTAQGRCLVRIATDGRRGDAEAFAEGRCSPGVP